MVAIGPKYVKKNTELYIISILVQNYDYDEKNSKKKYKSQEKQKEKQP